MSTSTFLFERNGFKVFRISTLGFTYFVAERPDSKIVILMDRTADFELYKKVFECSGKDYRFRIKENTGRFHKN